MTAGRRRLIGRAAELAAVVGALDPGAVVTIRGTGGVGKTCLAAAAAERWPPDAARTVELAAVPVGGSVAAAVGGQFGVAADDAADAVLRWASTVTAGTPLVVLDNAEHVVESTVEFVADLRARAGSGPALLVTSRRALAVPGETVVDLAPLPMDDAVALYRDRADDDRAAADAVARLCAALDRLPLGVELAAARARTLGPDELLARVDQLASLLVAGDPTSRHGSLVPLVRWSYDLLAAHEQVLFRILAVLPGSFDLTTVERMARAAEIADPVGSLEELVAAALVASEVSGSARRYSLLDTVRAVAGDLLESAGERDLALGAMVAWVVAVADEPWEQRVETCTREWPNVVTAVDEACRLDPERAGRLVAAIAPIVSHRGGDVHVDRWAAHLAEVVADPATRARLHTSSALIARRRGEPERAWRLIRAALDAIEQIGDEVERRAIEDETVFEAGHIAYATGDHAEAERLWRRSLDLALASGSDLSAAYALSELSWLEPDPDRAIGLLEQALRHFAAAGRDRDRAVVLVNLATMLLDGDRVAEAGARAAEAAELAAAAGSQRAQAAAANVAGSIALVTGRPADAVEHTARGVEIYETIGEPVPAARCRANVARALLHAGRVGEAVAAARDAVAGLEGRALEWWPQTLQLAAMVSAAAGDSAAVAALAARLPDERRRARARWVARARLLSGDADALSTLVDAAADDRADAGDRLGEDDLFDPTLEVEAAIAAGDEDGALGAARHGLVPDAGGVMARLARPRLAALAAAVAAKTSGEEASTRSEAAAAVGEASALRSVPVRLEVVAHAAAALARIGDRAGATAVLTLLASARRALGIARPAALDALLAETGASELATATGNDDAHTLIDRAEAAVLAALADRDGAAATSSSATLARRGTVWEIEFGGTTVVVPDAKGIRDVARLVAAPGRELAAVDLAGAARPGSAADPVLVDVEARRTLGARVEELRSEAEEARSRGHDARAERAEAELDAIAGYLARATGLGGRDRGFGGDAERARKAVTNRIRDAIGRIDAVHPELGRHLRHSVRTGTFCRYEPERPVTWTVNP